ncbi:MAG: glycosyltransferase family protein [Elusimicrobia bacterium]|nr:glycosyltransferase family protein [Elusimicrobiota bacterium]
MALRRVLVVQARMTSTRLPGKVLMDLAGKPLLARQLDRRKSCRRADAIVVATTTNLTDDPLGALAAQQGVGLFRGSEADVLSRYAGAAERTRADLVVRITSDCPLIDAEVVDRVIERLERGDCDYASNVIRRTYPRGLDAEALTLEALRRSDREAKSPPAREHVTYHLLRENPKAYRLASVEDSADHSDLRWTVDTAEDLAMVRAVYEALGPSAPYADVLKFVRAHPEISALNAHVEQKKT